MHRINLTTADCYGFAIESRISPGDAFYFFALFADFDPAVLDD
jgi:hypothetical protein